MEFVLANRAVPLISRRSTRVEMLAERLRSALCRGRRRDGRRADEVEQLAEMLLRVADSNERSTRPQHPCDLCEALAEVRHVVGTRFARTQSKSSSAWGRAWMSPCVALRPRARVRSTILGERS